MKYVTTTLLTIALGAILANSAAASPTMIRLGYADRALCHLSPQGAGLLTAYSTAVDEAQSINSPLLTRSVTNGAAARIVVSQLIKGEV